MPTMLAVLQKWLNWSQVGRLPMLWTCGQYYSGVAKALPLVPLPDALALFSAYTAAAVFLLLIIESQRDCRYAIEACYLSCSLR